MTVYTLCVNPESGRYMAIGVSDVGDKPEVVFSSSEDAALGMLVRQSSNMVELVFQHLDDETEKEQEQGK